MSEADPIVIVSHARTPMGGLMGDLAAMSANELGAAAVKAAVERAGLKADDIDKVIMGNVLMAGQGQAPARQAAIKGGLPISVEAVTINKMCGSGMQAAMDASASLKSGEYEVIVAGGMESMTNAPHLLATGRTGIKYGHGELKDHMALDGLEDAYEHKAMGVFADMLAAERQFTREAQDAYAIESLRRAKHAADEGYFDREITPVTVKTRKGDIEVKLDQLPQQARPEKIPELKPAFGKDGTVTAASASAISDGAAALVLMRKSAAEKRGLKPLAVIRGAAAHAHEPKYFTTAPIPAMQKALERAGWTKDEVDLWEINEAFAVVPMAAMKELNIPHDKVNVNGGACALGHPIGASGARIISTLLAELERRDVNKGVAALCIGGGEGTAVCVERL